MKQMSRRANKTKCQTQLNYLPGSGFCFFISCTNIRHNILLHFIIMTIVIVIVVMQLDYLRFK